MARNYPLKVMKAIQTKHIFVIGGVVSSIGKGIFTASLAALLKDCGWKVFVQKLDPYLNIDPGTMSPDEHGEVYVTADGAETDLDLGHYERFSDLDLTKDSNATYGALLANLLKEERSGHFLGHTIQIVPHVTQAIKNQIRNLEGQYDIIITEFGGTIGDIELQPFLEAIRQLKIQLPKNTIFISVVVMVIYLTIIKEYKTKPAQHAIRTLGETGIYPNLIITRSLDLLQQDILSKLALFCNVQEDAVIQSPNMNSIYFVPKILAKQQLISKILNYFSFPQQQLSLSKWDKLENIITNLKHSVLIYLIGKYTTSSDAYLSVVEALNHAGYNNDTKIQINMVDSETLTPANYQNILKNAQGIIIPGGFGQRGIEGKILAAKYARETKTPYLGLCLGLHIAIIEFARNVCGLKTANSTEFAPNVEHPVVHLINEFDPIKNYGGTLRLGNYPCKISLKTLAFNCYQTDLVEERHRHRYEINNAYFDNFTKHGFIFSGTNPISKLLEIGELQHHPFFLGTQFHPEFKSRPFRPHPLFTHFIKASLATKK